VFVDTFYNKIPDYLLWALSDFLSERSFFESHNNEQSPELGFHLGCVQGSVLGPVLFNMYLSDIANAIPSATIFAYADDSYATITSSSPEEAQCIVNETVVKHIKYLTQKGMVVNHSKTEVIYFSTYPDRKAEIKVGNDTVESQDHIKALGVVIDKNLNWNQHVTNLVNKIISLTSGLRLVTKHLKVHQSLRIITSQFCITPHPFG